MALVHDYLIRWGGAERVFFNLMEIFPKAKIYTLLYDEEKMGKYLLGSKIQTSFLQKFPKFWRKRHKYLLPFLPVAPETIDLREFDLVISSSSSFGKGIITRPKAIHICYCHSPMRFGWDAYTSYLNQQGKGVLTNAAIRIIMHYIRLWDRSVAERVDYFIANSKTTAQGIGKYYGRQAKVIYPPVALNTGCSNQKSSGTKDYFLIVSQLTPYKRVDLAVEAFNKLELPLVIIGEGPEEKRLRKAARQNITFLGFQPDEKVRQYYQNCQAFIFSGEDDFGITPVEAMSFGKPVLAYRQGGAIETIIEGITGEFFDDPAIESLADGVRRVLLNINNYSPLVIKKRAENFSKERFEREIKEFVIKIVEKKA